MTELDRRIDELDSKIQRIREYPLSDNDAGRLEEMRKERAELIQKRKDARAMTGDW